MPPCIKLGLKKGNKMKKAIKKELLRLIKKLNPEIQKRATFQFGEYKSDGQKIILADLDDTTKPPVITLYLRSLEKWLISDLAKVISHEIIHTFTEKEKEAYQKQNKMDFWRKT